MIPKDQKNKPHYNDMGDLTVVSSNWYIPSFKIQNFDSLGWSLLIVSEMIFPCKTTGPKRDEG